MDVNIATDMKSANVAVTPTNVEREDAVKPSVQPVFESSEGVTVKLKNKTQQRMASDDESESEEKQAHEDQPSLKELRDAVEEIQERFQSMGSSFKFGLHRDNNSERIVAQLRDKKTDEVIKQFPSDEVLKLREKLKDLLGLIFDEKV